MNYLTVIADARALTTATEGGMVTFGKPNKSGQQKVGSFARAIAFATKDERLKAGQSMYAQWLATGNYRPLVLDMLAVKLVSKDAADYIELTTLRPFAGRQIPKSKLVEIARFIVEVITRKGTDKAPKGEKAFVYEVAKRIAEDPEFNAGEVIEAQ